MKPLDLSGGRGASAGRREIWAIGSGKGGTGKSFLTASLGIALSKMGKQVILVDGDLGGANLHTCLGMDPVATSLSDFIQGRAATIEEVVVDTPLPNLKLISGAHDILDIANPAHHRKQALLKAIRALAFDYILLDLGAGTTFNTLDLFLAANKAILTVLPEPTSIENAYRFIKAAYFRYIKTVAKELQIRRLVEEGMDVKNEIGIHTVHDLIEKVSEHNPESGRRLAEDLLLMRPRLVVNQVRTLDDVTLGFSMRSSVDKYFGIRMEYAGYVEYDDVVWRAARERKAVLAAHPYASPARCVDRILQNLVKDQQLEFDWVMANR
jgi:flagellar biosynthesis protein FlhG